MVSSLVVLAALVVVFVILASVLGAVERRERFVFVVGVLVFIAPHSIAGTPRNLSVLLALAGLAAVLASTVPLLRQSV